MAQIKRVITEDGQAKQYEMKDGRTLTPRQAANELKSGKSITYKGQGTHPINQGKHIRTDPDGKPNNNLVKK